MQPINIPKAARDLVSVPPATLYRARQGEGDQALVKAVRAAQDASLPLRDCYLSVKIEAIRCLSFKFNGTPIPEGSNEVYVVGWAVDGKGQKSASVSEPYSGYKKGDLINCSTNGHGLPVATLKNPQDYVKWGFGVFESDKKSRTNAESIKKALADNDVKGAIDKVVAAAGGGLLWSAVVTAASTLGGTLLDLVARNGDDDMYQAGGGGPEPAFFHAHDPGESETHEGPYARVRYAVHLYK